MKYLIIIMVVIGALQGPFIEWLIDGQAMVSSGTLTAVSVAWSSLSLMVAGAAYVKYG